MHIDERHKGLATFRAHRAEKKEIAILTGEVAKSNPDKTLQECKTLALEIRVARKREQERVTQQKKNQKNNKGNRHQHKRLHKMEVTVVNRIKEESNA